MFSGRFMTNYFKNAKKYGINELLYPYSVYIAPLNIEKFILGSKKPQPGSSLGLGAPCSATIYNLKLLVENLLKFNIFIIGFLGTGVSAKGFSGDKILIITASQNSRKVTPRILPRIRQSFRY